MTHIGLCADDTDVGQLCFVGKFDNSLYCLVGSSTALFADHENLITLQEIPFGDLPASRVDVTEACTG